MQQFSLLSFFFFYYNIYIRKTISDSVRAEKEKEKGLLEFKCYLSCLLESCDCHLNALYCMKCVLDNQVIMFCTVSL